MRKSSINISKGERYYFFHNDRTHPTNNDIFNEENFYSCSAKEAAKQFDKLIGERSKKYKERTGRKIQSKAFKHLSAIVNLDNWHTENDLKKVVDYLENSLDTKVVQYVIHRTEGHIDKETGEKKINYHAHIEMVGLDSEGRSIRKKLTRQYLRNLQTITAHFLQMERGQKNSKRRRLSTKEYKEHKQQETQEVIKTQKRLKEEIKQLREELKKLQGIREDYSLLEQENRRLKEQIKNKETVTIDEIYKLKEQLKEQIESRRTQTIKQEVKKIVNNGDKHRLNSKKISFNIEELKSMLIKSFKRVLNGQEIEKTINEYIDSKKQEKEEIDSSNERLEDISKEDIFNKFDKKISHDLSSEFLKEKIHEENKISKSPKIEVEHNPSTIKKEKKTDSQPKKDQKPIKSGFTPPGL